MALQSFPDGSCWESTPSIAKLSEDSWERCKYHEVDESGVGELSNLMLSHPHITVEEENIKEDDNSEGALENNGVNTKQLGEAFGKLIKPSNICRKMAALLISPRKSKSEEGCFLWSYSFV